MQIKKVAMLTGGGDCPGLNAVIRALTRRGITEYGWEVIGFRDGYRGLVLDDWLPLTYDSVSGLLDRGGTILGTSNRDNPFNFRVEDGQGGTYRDMSQTALENCRRNQVDALICIGGDGTMTAANIFSQMGLPVVGVPKTIDNDLLHTDYTFGFHTAVDTATDALDKLHSTAESHHRLMVLEVMGRYAGWLALHSGLAGGADVILIPEIPYNLESIVKTVERRRNSGRHYSLIVVSEGVRHADGRLVVRERVESSPDKLRLGGIGNVIASDLAEVTGIEARAMVLGHLQRGGRPIPMDRVLATRFGAAAAQAVQEGDFGNMVAVQAQHIARVPLGEVAGKQRLVSPADELVQIGRSIGVSFGD
jgi:6-phosphofructokinase 1